MKKITSLILAIIMIFVCIASLASCGSAKYVEISVENYGKIVVELDSSAAPKTVKNFTKLVKSGFYDGLTFHRIIDGFMIQGGDPEGTGSGGSDKEIYGEFLANGHANPISHTRGVISMARANDPDSASSQFFICHDDATYLDGNYAAFGYVVEGMDVVDAIVRETMNKCVDYYGDSYYYWLYYGNGSLTDGQNPIKELQPKIEYIKVLDSWENSSN